MSPVEIGVVVLLGAVALTLLRLPVALALGLTAFAGAAAILPLPAALSLTARLPFEFAASWEFAAVPLFLAMGAVITRSGLAEEIMALAEHWLRRAPGGLAVATNLTGAGFGAVSGSSMASTVALGRMAVPQMLRSGYDPGLATATVASAGTLAALIPPSIPLIVYGILSETSVAKLFFAGIVPGLLTAFAYAAMIMIRCHLNPSLAPPPPRDQPRPPLSWRVLALPLLALVILLGIYRGLFSPNEAGAVGMLCALVLALPQKGFGWRGLVDALAEATRQTAAIITVAMAAFLLTRTMALTGMPDALAVLVDSWSVSPLTLILGSTLLFVVMGMVLDPFGVMLLSVAVLLPTFEQQGFDLIWLGIIIVKLIEIGLLTPPVGLNVFAAKSVAPPSIALTTIFRGVSWFLLAEVGVMAVLILFPGVVLWLPQTLSN